MKLHEIPRGSKIKVEEGMITFHHLDGMYSYCTCDWIKEGEYNVTHLHALTQLEKEGDYYKISEVPLQK